MDEFTIDFLDGIKECSVWEDPTAMGIIHRLLYKIERLRSQIAELKDKQRWIPVTERLPERRQFVLVTDCLNKYIAYTADTTDDVCFYSQKGGWLLDSITHWMELPEPPKEEE